MLKGHATIDLHDVVKGTYKRIEHENLVTNAYKYHLQSVILMNNENSSIEITGNNGALSIGDVALGGLLLFNGQLTENVENIHYPGDCRIVGYADHTSDTTNPQRGSYNSIESGKSDDGITHVWDFTTAQGNGLIAALSLTNIIAGADPIGKCINTGISGGITSRSQFMYHDGTYGYYLDISGNTAIIRKMYQPQTNISVNTYNIISSTVATYNIDMSGDAKAIKNTAYWQYAGNGNFYGAIVLADNSDTHSALTVRVAKIHTDDWENFTYTAAQDITLDGVTARKTITSDTTMYRQPPVVSGHHIYIQGYEESSNQSTKMFIADLDNISDIIETSVSTENMGGSAPTGGSLTDIRQNYPSHNGTADFFERASNNAYYRGKRYPDGIYAKSSTTSLKHVMRGLAAKNMPINAHYNRGAGSNWGVFLQTGYLGTICNLSSPIEKTSAQTMKVTYTLTDVR